MPWQLDVSRQQKAKIPTSGTHKNGEEGSEINEKPIFGDEGLQVQDRK